MLCGGSANLHSAPLTSPLHVSIQATFYSNPLPLLSPLSSCLSPSQHGALPTMWVELCRQPLSSAPIAGPTSRANLWLLGRLRPQASASTWGGPPQEPSPAVPPHQPLAWPHQPPPLPSGPAVQQPPPASAWAASRLLQPSTWEALEPPLQLLLPPQPAWALACLPAHRRRLPSRAVGFLAVSRVLL